MSAGMGLMFFLFAGLLFGWPSERARRLAALRAGRYSVAFAAVLGWVLSGLAIAAPPLAVAYGLMIYFPIGLLVWRWAGVIALFWLATAGALSPSFAYRPYAANDNHPRGGLHACFAAMSLKGYSWRLGLMVAALLPQFFDAEFAPEPQILFASGIFTALTLAAAAFYGLFPERAHEIMNALPERHKALKTGFASLHQHGQTRVHYGRKAA